MSTAQRNPSENPSRNSRKLDSLIDRADAIIAANAECLRLIDEASF